MVLILLLSITFFEGRELKGRKTASHEHFIDAICSECADGGQSFTFLKYIAASSGGVGLI